MLRMLSMVLALCLLPFAAAALDERQQQRFDRIMQMKLAELTAATEQLLAENYPAHDWDQDNFPDYVYVSDAVEMGYRIAVVAPELLGRFAPGATEAGLACYCFCDAMGHRDLLSCFLRDGKLANGYDDHGAGCNICYGQAMLAFLWHDAGASHQEIVAGMEKRFARLLQRQQEKGE